MKYSESSDKYCYRNTSILRNKLNIEDQDQLELVERELSLLASLSIKRINQPYNLSYWQYIHKQLFQNLYCWAGLLRDVDISKADTRFCHFAYIEKEANKYFSKFSQIYSNDNLSKNAFITSFQSDILMLIFGSKGSR